VEDAVAALLAAADRPEAPGQTFMIAHPEPVTWARFARTVGTAMGRNPVLVSLPTAAARVTAWVVETASRLRGRPAVLNRDRVREISQARWVCDPTVAMRQLGFHPQFPVSLGVARTADWYRKEKWL
jgi:nucleoside-diphosphate-sugar epimerase